MKKVLGFCASLVFCSAMVSCVGTRKHNTESFEETEFSSKVGERHNQKYIYNKQKILADPIGIWRSFAEKWKEKGHTFLVPEFNPLLDELRLELANRINRLEAFEQSEKKEESIFQPHHPQQLMGKSPVSLPVESGKPNLECMKEYQNKIREIDTSKLQYKEFFALLPEFVFSVGGCSRRDPIQHSHRIVDQLKSYERMPQFVIPVLEGWTVKEWNDFIVAPIVVLQIPVQVTKGDGGDYQTPTFFFNHDLNAHGEHFDFLTGNSLDTSSELFPKLDSSLSEQVLKADLPKGKTHPDSVSYFESLDSIQAELLLRAKRLEFLRSEVAVENEKSLNAEAFQPTPDQLENYLFWLTHEENKGHNYSSRGFEIQDDLFNRERIKLNKWVHEVMKTFN